MLESLRNSFHPSLERSCTALLAAIFPRLNQRKHALLFCLSEIAVFFACACATAGRTAAFGSALWA
jgi:hypothetical protein